MSKLLSRKEIIDQHKLKDHKFVAVYGSLRPTEYNFKRFKSRGSNEITIVEDDVEIPGYKLYSLGPYPGINRSDNPEDKVKVTLLDLSKAGTSSEEIYYMELGAHYEAELVDINGTDYVLYVHRSDLSSRERVEDGDWPRHIREALAAEKAAIEKKYVTKE